MKNIFVKLLILMVILVSPLVYGNRSSAQASLACDGLTTSVGGSCEEQNTEPSITGVIRTALSILSLVAGVIAVIMIIVAGLKFITSQGDAGAVSSARSTVIYALVGIVIVLLSQVIVRFVLSEATTPPPVKPPEQGAGVGGGVNSTAK